MCESRAVPSGKVYRQLFDAQVQLSRSLLAGRRDTRTESLSAEDSDTPCSSTSRWLYPVSSRGKQLDEEADDVSRLPDIVVAAQHNSDIIRRLTEKKRKEHEDALKNFNSELTRISEMCATLVRSFSREMLSSLQEVDLRLKDLKDRMDHVNGVSLQGVFSFWEEAEKELKLKKMRVMELHHVLSKFEADRTNKIRDVFRKYCHLLNKISFLPASDVCRLIHNEASLVNQSLLANRRNVAFLQLRLREENLQQTSLYRLHWDHCLGRWRRNRIGEVVAHFRCLCSSEADQQLVSVQQTIQQMKETQRVLEERRCDIISQISSLVPPYCSNALVSDWFNQLTTVNQQIESLHADFLHQLRCCCEQKWQERLAEVERSKEELLALQLTEEEVDDAISAQLLPLIGQSQSRDEERLSDLDLLCDTVARRSLTLSSSAFAVMRGAVLLWETHLVGLERRKEELERHLDKLRASQQQRMQWRKLRLDNLLAGLRQESSENALKTSLDKTASYMEDIKLSCSKCVPDQCQLFDRLPSLCVEEFLSYSSSLSSFYHLDRVYTPSREKLQELHPPLIEHQQAEASEETRRHAPSRHDWLTEAESSLLELYDISNNVTFTSSSGVAYTGPAFRYPDPELLSSLQQEGHLSQFPEVLLIDALSRTRTLFMDHLEQHLSDSVNSAITIVSNRKETLRLKEELQLKQLDRKYIQRYICQPRLAELQRHRRRVNIHCEEVMGVLDSCKVDMQKLETSISRRNEEFLTVMSNMERDAAAATRSHQLGSLGAALQDRLDQHIKHTQRCETTFRQAVQAKVEEIRRKTTQLLSSFRLFSEGGDFAPQELKLLQRRLTEEAKQIVVKEEAFYSDMEEFESSSLQQVREVSTRLEENICLMKSEMEFKEQSQQVYGSTQVHLKAEVVGSSQQQSDINNRLEDLKRMMTDAQVCPDRVLSRLSSANGELKKRRQYLELPPRAQKAVVEAESRGRTTAGKSPKRIKQRASKLVRTLRRHVKFIRSDKSFQVFGPEPGPEQSTHTFSSRVTSVLWKANDKLLMDGEEFYRAKKSSVSKLLLLPETLELWAASMQQRLLGYQKETQTFLSSCREVLEKQLATWDELLRVIPSVLLGNLEHRHEAELRKAVGGVKVELEEALSASEKEKFDITCRLRVSLRSDLLQSLVNREELRQQQLHSAICSAHMQIQEYVRVIGDEFVTSLASITERLLHQLDTSLTSTEAKAIATDQPSDNSTVTMETEEGQNTATTSRTWPGIPYYPPPTNIPVDLLPIVTTRRTASITTTKCTMGHLTVIELRDTAVQRFEQLLRTELSQSEDDKHERLKELQRWNTHWRQQIHPLKNTL